MYKNIVMNIDARIQEILEITLFSPFEVIDIFFDKIFQENQILRIINSYSF